MGAIKQYKVQDQALKDKYLELGLQAEGSLAGQERERGRPERKS